MNLQKKIVSLLSVSILGIALLLSCEPAKRELPILGEKKAITKTTNGKEVTDTVYFQIPDFQFVNQDSQVVTQDDYKGKIYVADFFFTSCPTICPVMKTQMLRLHKRFKNNADVKILSHTIDPRHDTVGVLKDYASRLQVDSKQWNFVTGNREVLIHAQKGYLVSALEDKDAAGGFVHSAGR
jgi:protein SCO1